METYIPLGERLLANLKAGRPTQTKNYGDYIGSVIEPSGSYAGDPTVRPPWLVSSDAKEVKEAYPKTCVFAIHCDVLVYDDAFPDCMTRSTSLSHT